MKHLETLFERYPSLNGQREPILHAFRALYQAAERRNKIMICGNGGSAADAEHIVGELMKEFYIKRPMDAATAHSLKEVDSAPQDLLEGIRGGIPAISLVSQSALISAIANDCASELVFAQQVYGYGEAGDVLIALSTSGNSQNVLNAVRMARAVGICSILICGACPGRIGQTADITIALPAEETYQIQELTLPVYHALCLELEAAVFGNRAEGRA